MVVAALPAIAQVGRVSGEQDGCFEFAGVHVVVVVAADAGGMAGVYPVVPARIQADLNCVVDIDFLRNIGKDVIAAVTIHHYQRINGLLTKGSTNIDNYRSRGGGRNAHGARESVVFMRAPKRNRGKLKHAVVPANRSPDGCRDQRIGDQREVGTVLLERANGSTATAA